MKYLAIVAVVIAAFVAINIAPAVDKITFCHVAGLASDPANYITLELPPQAVFGNGGHFNEDGTPQAGHEQDTMGACNPPSTPTPTPTPVPPDDDPPTSTPTPTPTPTTPTPTPTPAPPAERCPPGMVPTNGKDGEEGNDECEFPQSDPTPTATVPPAVSGSPPPTTGTTAVTPPTTVTSSATKPAIQIKAKSLKIVKVTKKQNGVVIIKTSDGKTHVGMMGAG